MFLVLFFASGLLHSWRHAPQALGLVGNWIPSGAFCQGSVHTAPAGTWPAHCRACLAGMEVTVPRDPVPLQGPVYLGHAERTDTGMRSRIRVAFLPLLYTVWWKGLSDSWSGPSTVRVEAGVQGLFSLPSHLCFLTFRQGWQCLPPSALMDVKLRRAEPLDVAVPAIWGLACVLPQFLTSVCLSVYISNEVILFVLPLCVSGWCWG